MNGIGGNKEAMQDGFFRSLVIPILQQDISEATVYIPPRTCPFYLSYSRRFQLLTGIDMESFKKPVTVRKPYVEGRQGLRFGTVPDVAHTRRAARNAPVDIPREDTKVVDDETVFVGADGHTHVLRDIPLDEGFFHDCNEEKGHGTPSAFKLKGARGDNELMHCFACGCSHFILCGHDPPLYECQVYREIEHQDE
jgi:hypothetical protein